MADGTIFVKVGQVLSVVGVPADTPVPPYIGPVDPGYSPPWAQVPPGQAGGGGRPIAGWPVVPGWGGSLPGGGGFPGQGGPVDPGYSPPWATPRPPGQGGGGPVDPGYSPPWAQVPPGGQGGGPVDPGYSPPWAQIPVDPPTEPPPTRPPENGHWVWAWSPQMGRWVWVKVPGEGEAGPKSGEETPT